jgi:diguanylate cyclase (GGDEF)-like protein
MELAVYDLDGKYRFVNHEYCPNSDIAREVIGQDDAYYFYRHDVNQDAIIKRRELFKKVLKEGKTIRFTEVLVSPKSNRTFYYKRFYQPIFSRKNNDDIEFIALFGSNITAIIHAQKELKFLAYHDKLTNLQNRDAFYEQVERVILEHDRDDSNKVTGILYCDLDNFKLVNDSLGHNIGDLVLLEAAHRIRSSIRRSDYVYRLGGDEFTVILRNLHHEFEAGKVADKIIRNVSQAFEIEGHHITYLTLSVGISIFPKDGCERELLVKKADTAMYNAKKKGKNKFQFFSSEMTDASVRRLELENNLMAMVRKNDYDNQLELLYQPIVEKKIDGNYKIIGTEALLRWLSPTLGPVLPDIFIPLAEENDLIEEIGDWVLYQTCKDFKKLSDKINYPLYVSINFSPKQLRSDRMISNVERIIKELDYNPANLQLELTETSYMDDEKEVTENLEKLKKLGIKLAIDDFGIGFASLVYLQKVPATTIKIDKSFIKYVCSSEKHKELVKSIILLGKNLKKDVIAEGVEAMEHLDFLHEQKCTKYQGFIFSKPLTIGEFEQFIRNEKQIHLIIS